MCPNKLMIRMQNWAGTMAGMDASVHLNLNTKDPWAVCHILLAKRPLRHITCIVRCLLAWAPQSSNMMHCVGGSEALYAQLYVDVYIFFFFIFFLVGLLIWLTVRFAFLMAVKAIIWYTIACDEWRSEWLYLVGACYVFERACGFLSPDIHSFKLFITRFVYVASTIFFLYMVIARVSAVWIVLYAHQVCIVCWLHSFFFFFVPLVTIFSLFFFYFVTQLYSYFLWCKELILLHLSVVTILEVCVWSVEAYSMFNHLKFTVTLS